MGKEGKKVDEDRGLEEDAKTDAGEDEVTVLGWKGPHPKSATSKLLKKLADLVGTENASSIYSEFTMDIIRAEQAFKYAGGDGMTPHVGRIKSHSPAR